MCKSFKARTPADLIDKVRVAEGWARVEGDSHATIVRMNTIYNITKTHNAYVATRKGCV